MALSSGHFPVSTLRWGMPSSGSAVLSTETQQASATSQLSHVNGCWLVVNLRVLLLGLLRLKVLVKWVITATYPEIRVNKY